MKPLRAMGIRCGVVCVVITMAVSAVSGYAQIARGADPMVATQPPSESRVPVDLFKTWNFDKERPAQTPAGFSSFGVDSAGSPMWIVAQDPSAQTPPNLLKQSMASLRSCPVGRCARWRSCRKK